MAQGGEPGKHGGVDVERDGKCAAMEPHAAPVRRAVCAVVQGERELRGDDGRGHADDPSTVDGGRHGARGRVFRHRDPSHTSRNNSTSTVIPASNHLPRRALGT